MKNHPSATGTKSLNGKQDSLSRLQQSSADAKGTFCERVLLKTNQMSHLKAK